MCILVTDKRVYEKIGSYEELIRNIILNKQEPFTMEEINAETKEYGVYDRDTIIDILTDLSDCGLISNREDKFYNLFYSFC